MGEKINSEEKYLVALYAFILFGPARTKLLIEYFGSARRAWQSGRQEYAKLGLKPSVVGKFFEHRENFDIEKYFEKLEKLNVGVLTAKNSRYPENLRDLANAPLVLYVKGSVDALIDSAVAVVGSRKMTVYGREVCEKLVGELARLGVCIVSGLALGIDAMAHRVCLEAGGNAVAVLASGLDMVTPVTNRALAEAIVRRGGALVSEYPLGTLPLKTYFPNRNRIISGLSRAVVVIEGKIQSGTIHTARHAAEQGREVFAVPGQITSPMSEAPHYLIKNGAKIAFSVKEIVDELNLQFMVDKKEAGKVFPSDKNETIIIRVLEEEEHHLDEIVRISGLTTSEVGAKLVMMEVKGLVKNLGSGVYKKV